MPDQDARRLEQLPLKFLGLLVPPGLEPIASQDPVDRRADIFGVGRKIVPLQEPLERDVSGRTGDGRSVLLLVIRRQLEFLIGLAADLRYRKADIPQDIQSSVGEKGVNGRKSVRIHEVVDGLPGVTRSLQSRMLRGRVRIHNEEEAFLGGPPLRFPQTRLHSLPKGVHAEIVGSPSIVEMFEVPPLVTRRLSA